MPMHDWRRVDAAIYHAFHHSWISEIGRALNRGLLPDDLMLSPNGTRRVSDLTCSPRGDAYRATTMAIRPP